VDTDLEKKELQKQLSLAWDLDKMVIDYLRQNYLFEDDEIKNNIQTFKTASKELDLMNFLSLKKRVASTKKRPKGWIIAALQKEIAKKQQEKEAVVNKVQVEKVSNIAASLANKFKV
jgi:hypothetical protein